MTTFEHLSTPRILANQNRLPISSAGVPTTMAPAFDVIEEMDGASAQEGITQAERMAGMGRHVWPPKPDTVVRFRPEELDRLLIDPLHPRFGEEPDNSSVSDVELDALAESLEAGQREPVVGTPSSLTCNRQQGTILIVHGGRRLLAAKRCDLLLKVRIIRAPSGGPIDVLDRLGIFFAAHQYTKPLGREGVTRAVVRALMHRRENLLTHGQEDDPLTTEELMKRLCVKRNTFNEAARLAAESEPIRDAVFQRHLAIRVALALTNIIKDAEKRAAFVEAVIRENADRHKHGHKPLTRSAVLMWARQAKDATHPPEVIPPPDRACWEAEHGTLEMPVVQLAPAITSGPALPGSFSSHLLPDRLQELHVGRQFLGEASPRYDRLCAAAVLDALELIPAARHNLIAFGLDQDALDALIQLSTRPFMARLRHALAIER